MEFILGLIILVLDIWAIYRAWTSSLSLTAKVLWTLLIIFLPVLGLILFLLFGRAGSEKLA